MKGQYGPKPVDQTPVSLVQWFSHEALNDQHTLLQNHAVFDANAPLWQGLPDLDNIGQSLAPNKFTHMWGGNAYRHYMEYLTHLMKKH